MVYRICLGNDRYKSLIVSRGMFSHTSSRTIMARTQCPPKYPKVAQNYFDLLNVQAMGDVQLNFHLHQTILSQVLLCVFTINAWSSRMVL